MMKAYFAIWLVGVAFVVWGYHIAPDWAQLVMFGGLIVKFAKEVSLRQPGGG